MENKITKSARVAGQAVSESDLALINQHSLKELKAEDVFTFKVAMCGNEIDRDFEVFPTKSLEKLAELFDGRTVISDHNPKAANQIARIYNTEVVPGTGKATTGEDAADLVAHCYMVKSDKNADMIGDIEAGILKEVSVGCSIKNVICSICGTDNRKSWCEHYNGRIYDGNQCHMRLENPSDAYELSFVAVPAQPNAGVTKAYGPEKPEKIEQKNQSHELIKLRIRIADMEKRKEN